MAGRRLSSSPGTRLGSKLSLREWLVTGGTVAVLVAALWLVIRPAQDLPLGLESAESLEALLDKASTEEKWSILWFKAPYCFPCHEASLSWKSSAWSSWKRQFLVYEINALELGGEGQRLVAHYGVKSLPAWVVVDEEGREHYRQEGGNTPEPSSLADLLAANQEAFQVLTPEPRSSEWLALSWVKDKPYWAAIVYAESLEPSVLEPVWIQQSSGGWQVLSGKYANREEAEVALQFLQNWEGQSPEITRLGLNAWSLP